MTTRRNRSRAVAALALSLLWGAVWAPPVALGATTILVNTVNQEINGDGFCSLQEAIYAANLDDNVAPDASSPGAFFDTACPAGSGHDAIELPPMGVFQFADPIDDADNFMGPTVTPMITSEITIEGRGARLERLAAGRLARAFAVGPTGYLDLREVHVKGFAIHGGNGDDGGGGGMGAGGAIYVQGGRLLVQWSTFESNTATGGNGAFQDEVAGGGGGGLSGDGGSGEGDHTGEFYGGGGGGGSRGDGGAADDVFISSDYNWGGGGGGRLTSAVGPNPGEPCGGAGGQSLRFPPDGAEDGGSPPVDCPGGGGGGGTDREFIADPFCGGDGGNGSYGGGGGGGGTSGDGGHGGFGGGGGGNGGEGGFGGGGGSENGCGLTTGSDSGQGGTFAGDGGVSNADHGAAGGGGAGLGGAIFGYLAEITISNSTFTTNSAIAGSAGGEGANDGRGAGGAIFTVAGALEVRNSTIAANEAVTVTNGGGGGIVVYDPEGTDEATLLLRNTIIANNGAHECYTRNGVDTAGSDGNIITESTNNNLDNPHCPGVDGSDDPGLGSLALNGGRTPNMAIGPGSNAINNAVGTVGADIPLDDQRGVLRPQGIAADIGAYEYEAPVPVGPVTTITLTPSTPNGSNGWYTSAVGVLVAGTDFDDAVDQTRCLRQASADTAPADFAALPDATCALTTVDADGEHTIYAASRDAAGHIEDPLVTQSLKLDATEPELDPQLNVTRVVLGQSGVEVSPNATDATSGVASASCDAVDTSVVGAQTIECTAVDNAGNEATDSLTVTIEYELLGFFSPVPGSKWKVKQTVPIKVAIGNGAGARIGDAEAAALARACRVTFSATGAQPKSSQCLKYDAGSDQFLYNWKLAKSPPGTATIVVSISYPGSTVTTTLSMVIEITG